MEQPVADSLEVVVRPVAPDDLDRYWETFTSAFAHELNEAARERVLRGIGLDRMLAAYAGDEMIGVTSAHRFSLTVPGGATVPAMGVAGVAVRPTHRRRGVLTAMMRRQLDDARAGGEPLAILWVTETTIYGRFGFGVATGRASIDVEPERAIFRDRIPPLGRTRLVGVDEAQRLCPAIYERVRPSRSGLLTRPPERWQHLAGTPWQLGSGPLFRVVLEIGGRPEGYALYRFSTSSDERGIRDGRLDVDEAFATTPAATRELWQYLFGIDLVARVRARNLAPDHPLGLMLTEPRRLRSTARDGLWIRVVDVPAALGARTYAAAGTLVFELADPFCPWNDGRWRLTTEPTGTSVEQIAKPPRTSVERTADPPDVRLGPEELGAAYLGGTSFAQLSRAGRVEEVRLGGVARADALFRSEIAPWCADGF